MRFDLSPIVTSPDQELRVGNVYIVKGGRGLSRGNMNVLVGLYEDERMCILLTIDKSGQIVGCTKYGMHYLEDLTPIAFVEDLEGMTFNLRSL